MPFSQIVSQESLWHRPARLPGQRRLHSARRNRPARRPRPRSAQVNRFLFPCHLCLTSTAMDSSGGPARASPGAAASPGTVASPCAGEARAALGALFAAAGPGESIPVQTILELPLSLLVFLLLNAGGVALTSEYVCRRFRLGE